MRYLLAALPILLASCSAPPSSACSATAVPARFERSPGGVPEVHARWVHAHHCGVRVVDVREPEERDAARLVFAESVPLAALPDAAQAWDPHEPIVLVCRSGRRSARASRELEDMGFTRVASMSGGMLVWEALGLPTERSSVSHTAAEAEPAAEGELQRADLIAHLGDADHIHWVRAASLVLQATQSCVDGRDARPIVGTMGGDAGELLLLLATLERVRGEPLGPDAIRAALDARLEAFGRFYLHTDTHALEALARSDARFAGHDPEALVRRPPAALEAPLLEALVRPEHVGCGHLRLTLSHPAQYGVRPELARSLLREIFRRLWQGAAIDFVVLEGGHEETGVLTVHLDHDVHTYSRIPTVVPRVGDHEVFVSHPQVSAWVRAQEASLLFEHDPWLAAHPARREAFLEALEQLGDTQLHATLAHLAARLPVYDAYVSPDDVRVEGPR